MPSPHVSFALHFKHLLRQVDVVAILDILLVATAIYYLLALAQGTRAMQLLKGLAILLVVMKIAQFLGMDTLYWFISQALFASAVVLVILFQPELRAALDQLGRSRLELLGLRLQQNVTPAQNRVIEEITRAVTELGSHAHWRLNRRRARDRLGRHCSHRHVIKCQRFGRTSGRDFPRRQPAPRRRLHHQRRTNRGRRLHFAAFHRQRFAAHRRHASPRRAGIERNHRRLNYRGLGRNW